MGWKTILLLLMMIIMWSPLTSAGHKVGARHAQAASPRTGLPLTYFRFITPRALKESEQLAVNERVLVDIRFITEDLEEFNDLLEPNIAAPTKEQLIFARVLSIDWPKGKPVYYVDAGDRVGWVPYFAVYMCESTGRCEEGPQPGLLLDTLRGIVDARAVQEGESIQEGDVVLVYTTHPSRETFTVYSCQSPEVCNLLKGKDPHKKRKQFYVFARVQEVRYADDGEPVYWVSTNDEEGWVKRTKIYRFDRLE